MDISKTDETILVKDMVIFRLKGMMDHVEGADKCTICEAIHQLEQPAGNEWGGNLWIVLIFLIFFGFENNSNLFDLETISKALNEFVTKEKDNEEETK